MTSKGIVQIGSTPSLRLVPAIALLLELMLKLLLELLLERLLFELALELTIDCLAFRFLQVGRQLD